MAWKLRFLDLTSPRRHPQAYRVLFFAWLGITFLYSFCDWLLGQDFGGMHGVFDVAVSLFWLLFSMLMAPLLSAFLSFFLVAPFISFFKANPDDPEPAMIFRVGLTVFFALDLWFNYSLFKTNDFIHHGIEGFTFVASLVLCMVLIALSNKDLLKNEA